MSKMVFLDERQLIILQETRFQKEMVMLYHPEDTSTKISPDYDDGMTTNLIN